MKHHQQVHTGIPALKSFYEDRWPGDISADPDFLPTDPDGLNGSDDEPDNEMERGLDSEEDNDEEEDGDINAEEGYVLWLIKVRVRSITILISGRKTD